MREKPCLQIKEENIGINIIVLEIEEMRHEISSSKYSQQQLLQVPNTLIKPLSLPRIHQVQQLKILKNDTMKKRQGYNVVNVNKKIQLFSYRGERKISVQGKFKDGICQENKQRSSLKVPIMKEKFVRQGGGEQKENTIQGKYRKKNDRKSNQNKAKNLKRNSIQHSVKQLFSTIQTRLKSSQSITTATAETADKKLEGYHKKFSRYLSLFQLYSLAATPISTPRQQIFEHKQNSNKCMNSMISSIGHELKKLEQINVKNSDIINKYVDGQLGLLELKRYNQFSKNKLKI